MQHVLSFDTMSSQSGLLNGVAGHLFYLDQNYSKNPQHETKLRMLEYIELLNKKLVWTFRNHSLCSGTAGIFWTGLHLQKNTDRELQLIMDPTTLVASLKKEMKKLLTANNYDYLHGAGGIIKVLAVNNFFTLEERSELIAHFLKIARRTPFGITWTDTFYSPGKEPMHLGIAHGVSGLINVLSCLSPQSTIPLIKPAIEDLYQRILATSIPKPGIINCQSNYFSWCTSFLGASWILLKNLKQFGWMHEYEQILQFILKSINPLHESKHKPFDYCICHGSLGVLVLLKLIAELSENPSNQLVYDIFCEKTLTALIEEVSNVSFQQQFEKDTSLLTGYVGTGSALAHLSEKNEFILQLFNLD